MKEKRSQYIVDHFVDENGDERHFVIAAISYDLSDSDYVALNPDCSCEFQKFYKGVKLGYSFCRPKYEDKDGNVHEDIFDEQLGINIALGRARKNLIFALMANYEGDINTDVVKALLQRRAKYFKNNPSEYIAGFKRKK